MHKLLKSEKVSLFPPTLLICGPQHTTWICGIIRYFATFWRDKWAKVGLTFSAPDNLL